MCKTLDDKVMKACSEKNPLNRIMARGRGGSSHFVPFSVKGEVHPDINFVLIKAELKIGKL